MTMIFETYAAACPSVRSISGAAFGTAAWQGTHVHGTGGFGAALFGGNDARAMQTAKDVAMLPARPWESTPPRDLTRL